LPITLTWSDRVSAECALNVSGTGWSRFGSTGICIKPFWRVSLHEVYTFFNYLDKFFNVATFLRFVHGLQIVERQVYSYKLIRTICTIVHLPAIEKHSAISH
jgi:hypothetical protein